MSPEVTVREFVRAFNERDLDAFLKTLSDDVVLHSMRAERRGLEEARLWATREPGGVQQTIVIESLVSDGDQVLAEIERQWYWDDGGETAGADSMAWLFRLSGDEIVSWRPYDSRDEATAALRAG